jgi:hypothetical protein
MRHRGELVFGAQADLSDMREWQPTVAQVRDVILRRHVIGMEMPGIGTMFEPRAETFAPSQAEIERVNEMLCEATRAGRFIDFGYIPNDVLIAGSQRGGPLWNQGAIGMPFRDPWALYHLWDHGVALYLVNPNGEAEVEIAELNAIRMGNDRLLSIADRGVFCRQPDKPQRYNCWVLPAMTRFWLDPEHRQLANNGNTPEGAAASNIGDPLFTALLILNTRNVERETVSAPQKLQKARAKARKAPIPSYVRINALPYVTAVQARGKPRQDRGEAQGGTHRSPVAHIRMGHPRHYASGRSIFIADTLVNVPEDQRAAFKSNRSHYRVNVNAREVVR